MRRILRTPRFKKALFLSHVMNDTTPLYGGKGSIAIRSERSIARGDSCNTMRISFPNHAGTHIDAPRHCIRNGRSITDFRPQEWIFDTIALLKLPACPPGYLISPDDIGRVRDCDLLLIKTGFEKYRAKPVYWRDSPGLHPSLARFLRRECPSLRAVGIDFISVSNRNKRIIGRKAHRAFLNASLVLIEDMRLRQLTARPDAVIVAPVLIEKADGAPCCVFGLYQ